MGTHHYYHIGLVSIKEWHDICGQRLNASDFEGRILTDSEKGPYVETEHLEYISPIRFKKAADQSYYEIDNCMKDFLEKTCEMYDDETKGQYCRAFIGILKITANLNLIPDNSQDYILYHLRLNTIILEILRGLNYIGAAAVIELYNVILRSSKNKTIEEYIGTIKSILACNKNGSGTLTMLLVLALGDNPDNEDYKIFKEGSYTISNKLLIGMTEKELELIQNGTLGIKYQPCDYIKVINGRIIIPSWRLTDEEIIQLEREKRK